MFRSAEKLASIAARVGVSRPTRFPVVRATACATRLHARVSGRCGVPSGDFGIGVVTKGSDRPLNEALWAEIEIDEIAAYTIAQTLPEPTVNSAIRKRQPKGFRKRQAKGSRVAVGRSLSACWAAEE